MTPAQLTALKSEVQTDPAAMGYAALLPAAPGQVCIKLNAVNALKCLQPRFVTARTILAEISGGGALLKALEKASVLPAAGATAQQVEVAASTEYALKFLNQDSGLDCGNPGTQSLIDALVSMTALTAAQGTALKGLAMLLCSRAQYLGLPVVQEADLSTAGVV